MIEFSIDVCKFISFSYDAGKKSIFKKQDCLASNLFLNYGIRDSVKSIIPHAESIPPESAVNRWLEIHKIYGEMQA